MVYDLLFVYWEVASSVIQVQEYEIGRLKMNNKTREIELRNITLTATKWVDLGFSNWAQCNQYYICSIH